MGELLNRDFLVRNLCFMYRLMVASVPLLEFAIPRSVGGLRQYYEKHLEEERGHDAVLLDDLIRMGVKDIPYDYIAAQLAGSQYYLIAHHHPALLLGYMGVLESSPLSINLLLEVEREHNCTLTAARLHAVHDVEHQKDLAILRLSMSDEIRAAIDWNAHGVKDTLQAEMLRWANAKQH